MQSAEVVDFAKEKARRMAAASALRIASSKIELAAVSVVRKLIDKISDDKAAGKMRRPDEYEAMMQNFSMEHRRANP